MVYMEISYTVERDDFRHYFARVFSRDHRFPTLINPLLWALSIVISAIPIYFVVQIAGRPSWTLAACIVPLLLISAPIVITRLGFRSLRNQRGRDTQTPRIMRLTDTGIEIVAGARTTVLPWDSITSIDEDKWLYYFEPARSAVHMLPKRALASSDEAQQFVRIARGLITQHGSTPANLNPPTGSVATVQYVWTEDIVNEYLSATRADLVFKRIKSVRSGVGVIGNFLSAALLVYTFWLFGPYLIPLIKAPAARNSIWQYLPLISACIFTITVVWSWLPAKWTSKFTLSRARLDMPPTTVRLDERGIVSELQGAITVIPWTETTEVNVDGKMVRFTKDGKPAYVSIPQSAFATDAELNYFVDVARAYIDHARTGNSPVFPEPISWPPPPNR